MKNFTLCCIIFFVIGLSSCSNENIPTEDADYFDDYLLDEMDAQHIPALSILIFNGDTILYERYLGMSNIDQKLNLQDTHLFLLASISKVVTATALLQLYENGLFDLDDPINSYLPFVVRIPDFSTEITFRMLLTHTSGIADNDLVLDGHYYYNQDPPLSLSFFMENYFKPDGRFYDSIENFSSVEPGNEYLYSNVASALIGVLIENISGQDFNAYCKDHIFTPMRMENTSWRLDEIINTMVTPYDYYDDENHAIEQYTNTDFPNGGLRSTVGDMFSFLSTIALGGAKNNNRLLNESTISQMLSPQIPSIDRSVGLHWFILDEPRTLWGHDGGEQGVATIMGFNPENKIGVIIFTNQGEADLDELFLNAYDFGQNL